MKNIKIAFFDVDGTLVNNTSKKIIKTEMEKVPKSTVEAIKKLQERGIDVVIATGRPPYMIKDLCKGLNITDYICFNGKYAKINNEVIIDQPHTNEFLYQVNDYIYKKELPILYMNLNNYEIHGKNQKIIADALNDMGLPKPYFSKNKSVPNKKIYQISIGVKQCNETEIKKFFPIKSMRWHESTSDFILNNQSKANTINDIIKILKIEHSQTIAFGDGINDVEMLQTVGFGIAMGNGHEKTKQVADYVTKNIDEDGVWYALKKLEII